MESRRQEVFRAAKLDIKRAPQREETRPGSGQNPTLHAAPIAHSQNSRLSLTASISTPPSLLQQDSLRNLSFEDFKNSFTTQVHPAEVAHERASLSPELTPSTFSPSPGTFSNFKNIDPVSSPAHQTPFLYNDRESRSKFPGCQKDPANATVSGKNCKQPYIKNEPLLDSVSASRPVFGESMDREQEPAKLPHLPSKTNIQTQSNPMEKEEKKSFWVPPIIQSPAQTQNNGSPQPQFGRPTALGSNSPLHCRMQPPSQPLRPPVQRQVSGNRNDGYSNLFISSKNTNRRPEFHQPPQMKNPLQQVRDLSSLQTKKWMEDNASSKDPSFSVPPPSMATNSSSQSSKVMQPRLEDGPVKIAAPTYTPTWAPKVAPAPVFSSQSSSNPFFHNRDFVDLTLGKIGMATNQGLFDDGFGAADPYTYVDPEKANDNIRALLEGAFEDDEDKPRTRRRKQLLEQKIENLVQGVKGMDVKGELDIKPEEDEEEEDDDDDGTVEGLKVKLLPHQIEGVEWMRNKELGTTKTRGVLPKGGILADDMGLGKTIQSLALILTNPKPGVEGLEASKRKLPKDLDKGTLVVAPLALIKQWEGEIKDRVEDSHMLRVCVHHGPKRTKNFKDLKKYDIVITTYHTLSSEHASSEGTLKVGCFGVNWYRIILDEAHSIKNRNAKATKAACAINAEYRWCLTGTPMQNNLDELQSLIHFLRIKPYDDLNAWKVQITGPMNNGRGGLAIKRLQVYLKAFMKRRTKEILKKEGALKNGSDGKPNGEKSNGFRIVKREFNTVEAEFSPEEREFYQRLESRADQSLERMMAGNKVSYASALVLLLRLRQACNHPGLIKSDLAQEKESNFSSRSGSQTPSRKKAADDIDSITDMLGGLNVGMKECDVCRVELSAKESASGAIRCTECERMVKEQETKLVPKVKREKKPVPGGKVHRSHNRRIVEDSDDEDDEEGDWVVPKSQRQVQKLGRAGGSVDEDAEGGGEWLDSDSDSDSEYVKPGRRTQPSKALDLTSDEEDEEEEVDSDSSSSATSDLISSTKIRHLLTILRRDSHTHKYIVFSFFTSMLDLIEPFLQASRIRFTRYDGQMRPDAREASLARLKTDLTCRVLLCSLRAGSLGLNLTAASRVVILEPFWNPFVEEQAIDRVHRLNQTQDVVVHRVIVKDTVEERILELQERKRELARLAIEGGSLAKGGESMKLTLQDMLKLFKHDGGDGGDGMGGKLDDSLSRGRNAGLLGERGEGTGTAMSGGYVSQPAFSQHHAPQIPSQQPRRKEHEIFGRRW